MVLEKPLLPYLQWLLYGGSGELGALPRFVLVVFCVSLVALLIGFIIAAGRHGIMRGGDATYHTVANGLIEILQTSPRRIWALARLAIKESLRRRVIVALGVYLLVLLFANWVLSTNIQEPARLYLSFVLTACTYLVLGVALLLSAFSLPSDFKSKTIYTVVTKPVRAGEIILGRIIGFTIVATVLLVIMGACSYVFVIRSLYHTHKVDVASLERQTDPTGKVTGYKGYTTEDAHHRHALSLDADGNGETEPLQGHTHVVEPLGENRYRVSGPVGLVRARVPQYGKLRFIDRSGAAKDTGISVGSEWTYRSFIDGNTPATAIWLFDNVGPELSPDPDNPQFPLALLVRVFRTHKGVIGRPISGQIQLRNPETGLTSDPIAFDAQDQQVADYPINNHLTANSGRDDIEIYKDLISENGQIEVLVKCLERGQYFGFAQADAYLRHPDGSPVASYAKVLVSIWVQAVIVIAVGVTISTLVSGPVALLFTVGFIILGFWRQDFLDIANGKSYGGGPAESVYRILTQMNVMVKLDDTILTRLLKGFDWVVEKIMWAVAQTLPDFRAFSTVRYAADGYNVPWDRVFQDSTTCLGYVIGLSLLGYFLLRTREVAQ
jgi:ABC-type transport system involved in multi-copper enzyme maturation permease subunit